MSGNWLGHDQDPDMMVEVITYQHAASAFARGVIMMGIGAFILSYGWGFLSWILANFPNDGQTYFDNDPVKLIGGFFAICVGVPMVLKGKQLLLYVWLVYVIDKWFDRRDEDIRRRGVPRDY